MVAQLAAEGDWGATIAALVWRRGVPEARRVLLGFDQKANADLRRWARFGLPPGGRS
jgi:hypothetical protein